MQESACKVEARGPLRFRPHHFLCALGFQGKGYSSDFTANMHAIVVGQLRGEDGDATLIEVTGFADDICGPCPKRRGRLCSAQAQISALDRRHANALQLSPREILTWGEAQERIRAHVEPGSLSTLCGNCRWLEYGLCEAALSELHAKPALDDQPHEATITAPDNIPAL